MPPREHRPTLPAISIPLVELIPSDDPELCWTITDGDVCMDEAVTATGTCEAHDMRGEQWLRK